MCTASASYYTAADLYSMGYETAKAHWSSHVQYIKSKLVRASYTFYKIRNVVSVDVSKMLYFSLVHCHLKYCIVSWGTATNSVLQPLELVHNNILRTITYYNYRCHITPLYKSLNILKLHDIYKLELTSRYL